MCVHNNTQLDLPFHQDAECTESTLTMVSGYVTIDILRPGTMLGA